MTAQTIYSTLEAWKPRHYYVLRNKTSGKLYVGQTTQPIEDYLGSGIYWKNHCKKHGGYTINNIENVLSQWVENEQQAEEWLNSFEEQNPGYYLEENKLWANSVPENTKDSPLLGGYYQRKNRKTTSERNKKVQRQIVLSGKHHWLSGELQRKQQLQRAVDGTHPFLGGKMQKEVINERLLSTKELRDKIATKAKEMKITLPKNWHVSGEEKLKVLLSKIINNKL